MVYLLAVNKNIINKKVNNKNMSTSVDTPLQFVKDQNSDNGEVQNSFEKRSESRSEGKLEKISFIILLLTIFISPIIFFRTSFTTFESIKVMVIAFGVLISSLLYVISLFKKNTISIPKNSLIVTSVLISISAIISAFLSTNPQKSFIGQGFEMGTVSFLILMFLVLFFVSRIASKNSERMMYVYSSIVGSFILLAIFHIVRLFVYPTFLSFGILTSPVATLIGSWSELGIFSGLVFILMFFAIQLLNTKKSFKALLYVLLVLSGFLALIVNWTIVWAVISLVLLAYGIYNFIQTKNEKTGFSKFISKISIFTLIILIISTVFAFKGEKISKSFITSFGIEQREIPLPWQLTLDVAADTIKNKPLFGAGPNRFVNEYLQNKPIVINQTDFWSNEFGTGYSWIFSTVVTQGLVGAILWIIFFVLFIGSGIKSIRSLNRNSPTAFVTIVSFFSAAFLWAICFVYNPSYILFFLTFVMTGLFVSTLVSNEKLIVVDRSRSGGTFSIIIIISIVLLSLWTLVYVKKSVATGYFRAGISALNSNNEQAMNNTFSYFKKALSWDRFDSYYQVISELDLIKINSLAKELQEQYTKDPKNTDPEKEKMINTLIAEAASSTLSAISIDPTNYYNHIGNARINELAATFKFDKAYENAKAAYENAIRLNPYNPQLYLNLARLEASQEKMDDAQKYIGSALQLKQNYTEAIFLLAQIQVSQNKIEDAITSIKVTTQIDPNNSLLYFQLGLLYYNNKDYKNSVTAFGKAVELSKDYSNARYFLGLSYARLEKYTEAIEQFEEIAKTNSENEEVILILSNLKAGKSPFADTKAPADSKPEKRSTLPVKEKTTDTTPIKRVKAAN